MDKFASEISGMLDSLNEERMDVYSEFDGLLKLMNDSWGNTDVIRYFHKIEEVEESYAFTELGWGFIDGEVGIYKKEHISGDYYEYNLVVDVRPDKIRLAMLEFDDFVEGLKDHIAHEKESFKITKNKIVDSFQKGWQD